MKAAIGFLAGWSVGTAMPHVVAAADDYPKRQIKIHRAVSGGCGPDQVARMLGQYLQEFGSCRDQNRAARSAALARRRSHAARRMATRC